MIATEVLAIFRFGADRYVAHLGLVRPRFLERLIGLVAAELASQPCLLVGRAQHALVVVERVLVHLGRLGRWQAGRQQRQRRQKLRGVGKKTCKYRMLRQYLHKILKISLTLNPK